MEEANKVTVVEETNKVTVVEDNVKPVLKKIVFALPGDNFSSQFLISWTSTISKVLEMQKYDIIIAPATGSFVSFVRMKTLGLDTRRGDTQKPFNNQDYN